MPEQRVHPREGKTLEKRRGAIRANPLCWVLGGWLDAVVNSKPFVCCHGIWGAVCVSGLVVMRQWAVSCARARHFIACVSMQAQDSHSKLRSERCAVPIPAHFAAELRHGLLVVLCHRIIMTTFACLQVQSCADVFFTPHTSLSTLTPLVAPLLSVSTTSWLLKQFASMVRRPWSLDATVASGSSCAVS